MSLDSPDDSARPVRAVALEAYWRPSEHGNRSLAITARLQMCHLADSSETLVFVYA